MMKKERFAHLDGLRGVAAIVVYLYHFALAFFPYLMTNAQSFGIYIVDSPLNFFVNGRLSVNIFFVLSGYVLSTPFLGKPYENGLLTSAAFRRYFRLAIPVFASSFLAYILLEFKLYNNYYVGRYLTRSTEFLAYFYLFDADFIKMAMESLYGVFVIGIPDVYLNYNSVLWTIYTEFSGSFLVYGFVGVFGRWRNRWIVYPVLILLFWNTFYLCFVWGILLCEFQYSVNKIELPIVVLWLILILGIFLGGFVDRDLLGIYHYFKAGATVISANPYTLWLSFGAAFIVFAVNHSNFKKGILDSKCAQFFGKISFSMYLLHGILICSLDCHLFRYLLYYITNPILVTFLVFIVGSFVLLLISYYFYLFIDKQSIAISKRIYSFVDSIK